MYLDVVDLRAFYAEHLGQVAAGLIGARLRKHWPSLKGERLLGMGYATPYLPALADGAVPLELRPFQILTLRLARS